jgi:hypothetical protein
MKRHWCVRRQTVARPDAIQRWDRAYQSILQWSLEAQHRPDSQPRQEVYHACSSLCPSLDPFAGQAPDD